MSKDGYTKYFIKKSKLDISIGSGPIITGYKIFDKSIRCYGCCTKNKRFTNINDVLYFLENMNLIYQIYKRGDDYIVRYYIDTDGFVYNPVKYD